MDTTQKTREEAAARRPRQGGAKTSQEAKRRPASRTMTPPDSAQQRNGAARTPEEQRSAAKRTAVEERPASPRPRAAAEQKKQPAQKKASAKKTAAVKTPAPRKQKAKADPDDISNKKRAYGNSKPKKKSGLALMAESVQKTAKKVTRKKSGKGSSKPQQPAPAVIYTDPLPFNRSRFMVQMITVVAVVVAFVLALSVFFKVEKITVSGAEVYSAWAIREASGISTGDNLLTFSHARAGAQIKANLPYVNTVRFGIKLPDTVNIIVEEAEVVYAIKDSNGQWWLMNSDGRVVAQTNQGKAANYTQVLGVTLESPAVNLQSVAAEQAPTETDASGEFIPVTVTGAQRLNTALQILKALEANDIVGDAASVDVTRTEDLILQYGTRYQVNLGDSTRLDHKIDCMNDVILQMSEYESGILDISFTHSANQVVYTPFS
nr:FtsQ-type POTRA domain-containing protein [Oscillospiraceae bacterium]